MGQSRLKDVIYTIILVLVQVDLDHKGNLLLAVPLDPEGSPLAGTLPTFPILLLRSDFFSVWALPIAAAGTRRPQALRSPPCIHY
jgi:hypothetical protein